MTLPSEKHREALAALAHRIEHVGKSADVSMLYRVAAPVFGALGWKPKLSASAAKSLVQTFVAQARPSEAQVEAAFSAALVELEQNVTNVERLAAVRKSPPVAYASWLRRSYELLVRAEGALSPVDAEESEELSDLVACTDPVTLAPPLVPLAPREPASGENEPQNDRSRDRVVLLELAAVDHLLQAARGEKEILARRRRLFEAARQVLLDASAALPLDPAAVAERKNAILIEITRLGRLEAAGVEFEVGLVHQARTAIVRGEEGRLRAVVAALDHVARSSGDAQLRRLSRKATHEVFGDVRAVGDAARRESLERSAEEQLGADVCARVKDAYENARASKTANPSEDANLARAERSYLTEGAHAELLMASLAIDGAFDLGGTLSPVRVVKEHRTLRRVPYPAKALALVPAEAVEDIPDALIEDPRTLVLQLATGRLLSRRYVLEEVKRTTRVVMTSEIRVFLLDGSGSMLGPRARVRDAMLVAELATLAQRLSLVRDVRTAVFFGYFTDEVGPIAKVDSLKGTERALVEVCGSVRAGGTDIQKALLAAFDVVGKARATDKELARAQVVLVTDGESRVDEAVVVAARELASGDIPMGVSVVALGAENPALRGLVARQRASGERAFYHFVDDATLEAMVEGALDGGLPLHGPPSPGDARTVARSLDASVGHIVTELEDLARGRNIEALEHLDDERQALREVGLDAHAVLTEGERARIESLHKDHASLARRFSRWFPEVGATPERLAEVDEASSADAEAVHVMLASIVEVVRVVGGSDLARRADAIDLVERLLPDAGLTPARYFATLSTHASSLGPALAALHAETRSRTPREEGLA